MSRGGLVALIGREPASHVGTTQFTTDDGETVELAPLEIAMPMTMEWEDIAAGRSGPLLAAIDAAAEEHHEQLTQFVLGQLETVTAATGNQFDASGRPFFEVLYETFETIELSFEEDGSISSGFTWVMHPDTAEVFRRREAEITPDQQRRLDELIERKRQEYFARRRRRKLS